jgi:hypothetical protein
MSYAKSWEAVEIRFWTLFYEKIYLHYYEVP